MYLAIFILPLCAALIRSEGLPPCEKRSRTWESMEDTDKGVKPAAVFKNCEVGYSLLKDPAAFKVKYNGGFGAVAFYGCSFARGALISHENVRRLRLYDCAEPLRAAHLEPWSFGAEAQGAVLAAAGQADEEQLLHEARLIRDIGSHVDEEVQGHAWGRQVTISNCRIGEAAPFFAAVWSELVFVQTEYGRPGSLTLASMDLPMAQWQAAVDTMPETESGGTGAKLRLVSTPKRRLVLTGTEQYAEDPHGATRSVEAVFARAREGSPGALVVALKRALKASPDKHGSCAAVEARRDALRDCKGDACGDAWATGLAPSTREELVTQLDKVVAFCGKASMQTGPMLRTPAFFHDLVSVEPYYQWRCGDETNSFMYRGIMLDWGQTIDVHPDDAPLGRVMQCLRLPQGGDHAGLLAVALRAANSPGVRNSYEFGVSMMKGSPTLLRQLRVYSGRRS